MRLDGKVAIVTGAASGIGAGIAERFVEAGASVVILDVNGQGARRVAESLRAKGPAFAVECDVAVEEQVKHAIAETLERFGKTVSDETLLAVMRVEAEYLQIAFQAMRARHASIDGYLDQALGLDGRLRERLHERLLA